MSTSNIHFVPRGQREQILARNIQSIYIVGHEKMVNTNHWCFYLAIGENKSVLVNCCPNYATKGTTIKDGYKANLIFSDFPQVYSEGAEKVCQLDVSQGLNVADFLDIIVREKRHQYEFNAEGTGCRNWVTDQITLLQKKGYIINEKQANAAREAILLLWPDATEFPIDVGEYF